MGSQGTVVAGKGPGEQLDALVWLIVDGSGVSTVKSEDGLAIRVGAIGPDPVRDDKIGPVLAAPVVGVIAEVDDRRSAANGYVGGNDGAQGHLVESGCLRGTQQLRAGGAGGVRLAGKDDCFRGGSVGLAG